MSNQNELRDVLRNLIQSIPTKPKFIRGLLGDGLGNVQVPNKPDRNFVRFNRGADVFSEVFNATVNPVNDWPVRIGELPWAPGLIQVVSTDWAAYEQSGWGDSIGSIPAHAPTHEWPDGLPGSDPLSVHMRSIVSLKGYVIGTGSTTFFVNSYDYQSAGTGTTFTGLPGLEFASPMSSMITGTARLIGVYLDPATNLLSAVTGTVDVFTDAFDPPRPAFPSSVFPISWVRVYGGQVGLLEQDIRDARRLFEKSEGTTRDRDLCIQNSVGATVFKVFSNNGNTRISDLQDGINPVVKFAAIDDVIGLAAFAFGNADDTVTSTVVNNFALPDSGGTQLRNAAFLEVGKDQQWVSAATRDGYLAIRTRLANVITEQFRILSTGEAGLGTFIPAQKFEAEDSDSMLTAIQISNTSTGDVALLFAFSGVVTWAIYVDDDNGDKLTIASTHGGTPRITIDSSGNIRLGDDTTNYMNVDSGGKTTFVGGAGLAFGEIYASDANDTITISSTGQANKVQVTTFDTNGASNNMTPDHTNDHITVDVAGIYLCTVSIATESGGGASFEAGFSVYKNNGATEFVNLHAHRNLSGGGGDTGSLSLSGFIDLAVNDTIELWVWNETNTVDIIVDDVTMSLTMVGGT